MVPTSLRRPELGWFASVCHFCLTALTARKFVRRSQGVNVKERLTLMSLPPERRTPEGKLRGPGRERRRRPAERQPRVGASLTPGGVSLEAASSASPMLSANATIRAGLALVRL